MNERLRELGYVDYEHYLRSRWWAKTKVRYRASSRPQACVCGETRVQLHHLSYERVGAERLEDLRALCERCHTLVHELVRDGQAKLGDDLASSERALAYWVAGAEARARREADRQEADLVRERRRQVLSGRKSWRTWTGVLQRLEEPDTPELAERRELRARVQEEIEARVREARSRKDHVEVRRLIELARRSGIG